MGVRKIAELWKFLGGSVEQLSDVEFDARYRTLSDKLWPVTDQATQVERDFFEAPFVSYRLGIRWHAKQLVFGERVPEWGAAIHEAGHVFVDTTFAEPYGSGKKRVEEIDFVGWELVAAKFFGVYDEWVADQSDYALTDDGHTFDDLLSAKLDDSGPSVFRRIMREQVSFAREKGWVKRMRGGKFYMGPVAAR